MFGLFASQEKKARQNAASWLELADKVWHFRRDVLPPKDAAELRGKTESLQQLVRDRADAGKLKLGIDTLEGVLRRTGGTLYPKTSLVENVEFFLVAAIVILGIRTYFVQPFKIPTNSMWPTYNGMTPEVYHSKSDEPSVAAAAARFAAFGATPHRLDAPVDGEIFVPVGGANSRGFVHSVPVPGRSWLVLPTTVRKYTLLVGDGQVSVKLPADFDFDWAIYDAFFHGSQSYSPVRLRAEMVRRIEAGQVVEGVVDGEAVRCIRTGIFVKRGERVLSFDELTGDQLFVDRFSYHFVRPSVGSGFVFRTGNIPELAKTDGDQYFIKRLVGTPGDTLEVDGHRVIRNGQPIAGSTAFEANARQLGRYPGYEAFGLLSPGQQVHVPGKSYFAMGDNSPNSKDSRYWGYVPAKDVVGRPLFVYFPFNRHWGPAR